MHLRAVQIAACRLLLAVLLATASATAAPAQTKGLSCAARDWVDAVADRATALSESPSDGRALRALAQAVSAADRTAHESEISEHLPSAQQRRITDFMAAQATVIRDPSAASSTAQRVALTGLRDMLDDLQCVSGADDDAPSAARTIGTAAFSLSGLRPVDGSPAAFALWALLIALCSAGLCLVLWLIDALKMRTKRHACSIACAIYDGGTLTTGRIIDISQTGCKMNYAAGGVVGTEVTLHFEKTTVKARVNWSHSGTVVLRFAHGLARSRVAELLEVSRANEENALHDAPAQA